MSFYSLVNSESEIQMIKYHSIDDSWFYLLAAAVLEAMAVYAWQYRKAPVAILVAISFALRAVWLVALVLVTVSDSITEKVYWLMLQQMCAIGIIPLFLLIVLRFTGQKMQTIRLTQQALITVTVFFWLVLLTTKWHGWVWYGVFWDGKTFGVFPGPGYWLIVAVGYCLIVTGLVVCLSWSMRATGLRRWQAWALLLGPLISISGHYFWLTGQRFGFFAPLPLSFMVSSIVWGGIFFGLRFFSLIELAESTVTRNMNDSMIVIDAQDYIVELNPAAQRMFGEQAAALVGNQFAAAFAPWPALLTLAAASGEANGEIELDGVDTGGYYHMFITPLVGWGTWRFGKVIVLHDISEQKKAQALILDQQKAVTIMAERERLGRELHDGDGQLWGYINLQVEAVCLLLAKKQFAHADKLLQRLAEVIRDAHVDIRESIAGLRTEVSTDRGLCWQPLEEYIAWFNQNNDIDAKLVINNGCIAGMLPPATSTQILRIIQEALTNSRKHAGAYHVAVNVKQQSDTIEIRVADDGRGFDPVLAAAKKGCYGIRIMKERAEEAGMQFKIESAPLAGTTIILSLPLTGK